MSDGSEGAERPSDSTDYQRVATFRFWYDTEQWEWSPETAVLHGYPAEQMTPTTDLLASHKHPEDRASFLAMVEQMRAGLPKLRLLVCLDQPAPFAAGFDDWLDG